MYRLLRNTHLLLGLLFFPFVLMFGVSSVRLAHNDWFPAEPDTVATTVTVDPAKAMSPRALGRLLMEQEGYSGYLLNIKETDGGYNFLIERIGTIYEISYQTGSPEARVTHKIYPMMAVLTWMHQTFGIDHEYGLHNFWGLLMLLTSVVLLVLGATGIYLWFKIHQERVVGSIVMCVSLVFGVSIILLLRFP